MPSISLILVLNNKTLARFAENKLDLKKLRSSKQGVTVRMKSADAKPIAPAYNHPWRTYEKKINGKPVVTYLRWDISMLLKIIGIKYTE